MQFQLHKILKKNRGFPQLRLSFRKVTNPDCLKSIQLLVSKQLLFKYYEWDNSLVNSQS